MSKYEYYIQLDKWYRRQAIKTFASILANNGIMDISEVAQLLGHVSEQTLINHYLYPTKVVKQGEKDLKTHLQCSNNPLGTLGNKIIEPPRKMG